MEQAIINLIKNQKEELETLKEEISDSLKEKIESEKDELNHLKKQLEILNPKSVLSRGYSISVDEKGHSISSIKQIKNGQNIKTIVSDGEIISKVVDLKGEK